MDHEKCLLMLHQNRFVFLVALLVSICPFATRASEAREFLIQSLEEIKSMQSFFEQGVGDSSKTATGQLLFQKPNLFRMEISSPVSQSITSDGEFLWTYDKDLEQVLVKGLTNSLAEMPFIKLLSEPRAFLEGKEIVSLPGDEKRFRLSIKENESPIEFLELDFMSGLISRILIASRVGAPLEVFFYKMSRLESMPKEEFIFVLPENVDLIDNR